MTLTYEEIENYIEQISSGIKILDIGGKTILFKNPSTLSLLKARQEYDKEYKKAVDEGLLTTDGMRKIIEDRKLITEKDRKELASLKSKLEAQKILLAKTTKVKANQDRIKNIIHDFESKIRKIESKERSKFTMTAETRAEESKLLFLCWTCCNNFETDELYWKTYEDFLNERDLYFRQLIMSEFILFYSGISVKHVRQIARSNLWRIRYVSSMKTSDPLFGVPTSQYSNDMVHLAYWSHYYQNIYEMMPEDQPSEDIIEDDEALDAYLNDYYKERTKDVASRKSKKSYGGKLSAFDKDEVIVTRSNELYEDIEYDKPREAQSIKDRTLVNKRTRRSKPSRVGTVPSKLPTK